MHRRGLWLGKHLAGYEVVRYPVELQAEHRFFRHSQVFPSYVGVNTQLDENPEKNANGVGCPAQAQLTQFLFDVLDPRVRDMENSVVGNQVVAEFRLRTACTFPFGWLLTIGFMQGNCARPARDLGYYYTRRNFISELFSITPRIHTGDI